MINYSFDRLLDDNELKSELRDLKLKIVSGEYEFKINKDFLKDNRKLINFIKSSFPNDIVSGSFVLRSYGLINRELNDLDILINDSNRYTGYTKGGYNDEEDEISNRLGYKEISHKWFFL